MRMTEQDVKTIHSKAHWECTRRNFDIEHQPRKEYQPPSIKAQEITRRIEEIKNLKTYPNDEGDLF